ncbi:hypothetical protein WJX84_001824, partial [Apatococcus fuscideae]
MTASQKKFFKRSVWVNGTGSFTVKVHPNARKSMSKEHRGASTLGPYASTATSTTSQTESTSKAEPHHPPGDAAHSSASSFVSPFAAASQISVTCSSRQMTPAQRCQLEATSSMDMDALQRVADITDLVTSSFQADGALAVILDEGNLLPTFAPQEGLSKAKEDQAALCCPWDLKPPPSEVLLVTDALQEPRFAQNELVTSGPRIRSFAAAPLMGADGAWLGSLCVVDSQPDKFTPQSALLLFNFAAMMVRDVEQGLRVRKRRSRTQGLSEQLRHLTQVLEAYEEAVALFDASDPKWLILFVNNAFLTLTGRPADDMPERGLLDMFSLSCPNEEEDEATFMQRTLALMRDRKEILLTGQYKGPLGLETAVSIRFRPAISGSRSENFSSLAGHKAKGQSRAASLGPHYLVFVSQNADTTDLRIRAGRKLKREPFDDVKVGPLLGAGSYGRVYKGTWQGATVAVKVIEHMQTAKTAPTIDGTKTLLEAIVSIELSHPSVVHTYKFDTIPVMTSRLDPAKQAAASAAGGSIPLETWLVLEWCDQGSLQAYVDKGSFRKDPMRGTVHMTNLLATAKEIAGGMAYLHSQDLMHGDLTASNILLASSEKDQRHFAAK